MSAHDGGAEPVNAHGTAIAADSADDSSDSAGAVPDVGDRLLEEMRKLQATFDAKIKYDEVREGFVESMSAELAEYRRGAQLTQVRSIILDLIAMYDDLSKVTESAGSPHEAVAHLMFFRDTVEQTLARQGVERFTFDGDSVDRTRQRVIETVETADPAAGRLVADRLRPGFVWNGKVLRPEWVRAYRYVAPPPADEAEADAAPRHDDLEDTMDITQVAPHSGEGASS